MLNRLGVSLVLKTLATGIIAFVVFGAALFLPAGTLDYWNAWVFLGIFILPILFYYGRLLVQDPEFLSKRLKQGEGERTQLVFRILLPAAVLIGFLTAGFDHRFHWSHVAWPLAAAFSAIVLAGNVLSLVVLNRNRYASQVVEIQEGQKLIDSGPYAVVRHPMYSAYTVIFCFAPPALGSLYALIPAVAVPLFMAMRISNEEKVLASGLPGYEAYRKRVRYRMIPFLW